MQLGKLNMGSVLDMEVVVLHMEEAVWGLDVDPMTEAKCNTKLQLGKMSRVVAGALQQALIGGSIGIKLAQAVEKGQHGMT